MWYQKIIQIFKIKDLRNKILFVLAVFAVFRIMANVPIPGFNAERMREFFEQNQFFGLLNLFTGGALDNLSIVMLGLGPYITAVIILQLLTMIFPQLERMYKEEGESGRQKFNQYGRIATVPLAMLQGYAMLNLLQRQGIIDTLSTNVLLTSLLTVAAGTVFLMWLGELITEKGENITTTKIYNIGRGESNFPVEGKHLQGPIIIKYKLYIDDNLLDSAGNNDGTAVGNINFAPAIDCVTGTCATFDGNFWISLATSADFDFRANSRCNALSVLLFGDERQILRIVYAHIQIAVSQQGLALATHQHRKHLIAAGSDISHSLNPNFVLRVTN